MTSPGRGKTGAGPHQSYIQLTNRGTPAEEQDSSRAPTNPSHVDEHVIDYSVDPAKSRAVFKAIAQEHPDRINLREFMSACHALGVECTNPQIQEVFNEITAGKRDYVTLSDFEAFLQPEEEDEIVKVQRKLQMNIEEIETDEEASESSGEYHFQGEEAGDFDEHGRPKLDTGSRSPKRAPSFQPKYTVAFNNDLIKNYLIPGPTQGKVAYNAFVKPFDKNLSLSKRVKAGSKVIRVENYNVTGLPFDSILEKLDGGPPFTIQFKHPSNIPNEEKPESLQEHKDEDEDEAWGGLVGSPVPEGMVPSKPSLASKPLWQYPLLLTWQLFVCVVYWGPPLILVTTCAFSLGILVTWYKLVRIIWDPKVRGWSTIKERHFDGVFTRLGNYMEEKRKDILDQKAKEKKAGQADIAPHETPGHTKHFLKFALVKVGDWKVEHVIDYLGTILTKEWVMEFERNNIDGSYMEEFQTPESLATIDPDPLAIDSKKKRAKIAKELRKQFSTSVGLKIAKSIYALFYSALYLGPATTFWMWEAWIRRPVQKDEHSDLKSPNTVYIDQSWCMRKLYSAPLPDTKRCWPGFRHSPETSSWRIRVYLTMEDESYSLLSYFITILVMLLIFVSTAAYIGQTIPQYEDNDVWDDIELVVSLCFTLEYGVRILVCRDMWSFFIDPMNMIDFLAVIPFWIEVMSQALQSGPGGDSGGSNGGNLLRVIRVIRLARVVRLLKSKRFAEYLEIFKKTLSASAESFGLLVTIVFLETIIFASLIFVTERGELVDDPTNEYDGQWVRYDGNPTHFVSIPAAAYWCIVTMTTVGYGDQYPITVPGKIVGCITMFTGLLVIALPVIIVGGNFEQVYQEHRKRKELQQKRERIVEARGKTHLKQDALERYERGKRSVIELAKEVNEFLKNPNFLTYEHVEYFLAEDFDSRDRIVAVLRHKHGFAFLPQQIDKYRRFILYESFGKYLRKGNKPKGNRR